jgi:hypothetical protein
MTPSAFNSKATYLTWRSQWKADYKALSQTIREHKADRKYDSSASPESNLMRQSGAQCRLYVCRRKAAASLEALKLAKQEAQRQYQAAHAVAVPALKSLPGQGFRIPSAGKD